MIYQHNNYNHLVGSNMQLAMWMMYHFRSDFIPHNFRGYQEEVCDEYKLSPSNCMHIGMAPPNTDRWKHLNWQGCIIGLV